MRQALLLILLAAVMVSACGPGGNGTAGNVADDTGEEGELPPTDDPLVRQARNLFSPVPLSPPELEGNPSSPAKVELGKMLYFEPRLSSSWLISCNTCHNLGLGGNLSGNHIDNHARLRRFYSLSRRHGQTDKGKLARLAHFRRCRGYYRGLLLHARSSHSRPRLPELLLPADLRRGRGFSHSDIRQMPAEKEVVPHFINGTTMNEMEFVCLNRFFRSLRSVEMTV